MNMTELNARERAEHALYNKKQAEKKCDNLMLTFWAQQHRLWLIRSMAEKGKKACTK